MTMASFGQQQVAGPTWPSHRTGTPRDMSASTLASPVVRGWPCPLPGCRRPVKPLEAHLARLIAHGSRQPGLAFLVVYALYGAEPCCQQVELWARGRGCDFRAWCSKHGLGDEAEFKPSCCSSYHWPRLVGGLEALAWAASLGIIGGIPGWATATSPGVDPSCWRSKCHDPAHRWHHPVYDGWLCWPQPVAYLFQRAQNLRITDTAHHDYPRLKLTLLTPNRLPVNVLWANAASWELDLFTLGLINQRTPSQVANHLAAAASSAQLVQLASVFTALWLAADGDDAADFLPGAMAHVDTAVTDAYRLHDGWHLPPRCP